MKIPDKLYNFLKWFCLIALPAVSLLLNTILPVYGVSPELIHTIIITINAVAVFIGSLIGVSQIGYAQQQASDAQEEYIEAASEDEEPIEGEVDEEA